MVQAMSKKQRREPRQFGLAQKAMLDKIEPQLGRYVAPECSLCKRLDLPNRRSTFVNGTETRVNSDTEVIISRSIKCTCGNAWTDYEVIKHKRQS
jgi:hypothetical protein